MMNNLWQAAKGYLAGAIALIACPCHLPLTFPLILSLTAGTALGSWLTGKFGLIFAIASVIFLAGLGLSFYWLNRKASTPTCAIEKETP